MKQAEAIGAARAGPRADQYDFIVRFDSGLHDQVFSQDILAE